MTSEADDARPHRGRPHIGGRVTVALGDDVIPQLDAYAAGRNLTRSEAIRSIVEKGLSDQYPYELQELDPRLNEWCPIQRFQDRGHALLARDRELHDEPAHLPKGRHRVVNVVGGQFVVWGTESVEHLYANCER